MLGSKKKEVKEEKVVADKTFQQKGFNKPRGFKNANK